MQDCTAKPEPPMLDGVMRRIIDPPLNILGKAVAGSGITANQVTLAGLGLGLLAAGAIALNWYWVGLVFIALSRLADGLDGAVARVRGKTDFGGFLDIALDFLFYGAVPVGFVIADPASNAVPGAVLLAAFYFNGATFLGYSALAERRGMQTSSRGAKSLYFTGGLLEGTETILFFALLCIWPVAFPWAAIVFAALCFVTGVSRILLAKQVFAGPQSNLVEPVSEVGDQIVD
jgi:phosphatidylglycerophosphate synthase